MSKKLNLNQLKVSSFVTDSKNQDNETVKGGTGGGTSTLNSVEPEFCNWTYNRWCVSNGTCNTYELWCTAPY